MDIHLFQIFLAAMLSGCVGWWLAIKNKSVVLAEPKSQTVALANVESYLSGFDAFSRQVTPIWSAQIESSRLQMERAIADLTQRFEGVVRHLDGLLKESQWVLDRNESAFFESSVSRLGEVLITLDSALQDKQQMLEEIRGLQCFVAEMKSMSREMLSLSEHAKLIALNAAVEAARAGESGQDVAVLADEIGKLLNTSSYMGKNITAKIEKIGAAMTNAFGLVEQNTLNNTTSILKVNETIRQVLDELQQTFSELKGSPDSKLDAAQNIQLEIAESLVQFQFQDRISQTLTHVRDSIDQFPVHLARSQKSGALALQPIDVDAMLSALQSSYVMQEEHLTHGGGQSEISQSSEITFF